MDLWYEIKLFYSLIPAGIAPSAEMMGAAAAAAAGLAAAQGPSGGYGYGDMGYGKLEKCFFLVLMHIYSFIHSMLTFNIQVAVLHRRPEAVLTARVGLQG